MAHERRPETSLYGPVKRYLETLGFTVKGEVCGCDLVAIRGDEQPVVVVGELKLSFSLDISELINVSRQPLFHRRPQANPNKFYVGVCKPFPDFVISFYGFMNFFKIQRRREVRKRFSILERQALAFPKSLRG